MTTTPGEVLSYLASLAGPLIAAAGFVSGVWYRMESRVENARKEARDGVEKARTEATNKNHALEKEISDLKLKLAEEYASWETVRSIESRLTERMDLLSESVMKMPDAVVDRIMKYLALKPAG
ncbi:hypothetical protein [Bradyrhizobium sp. USDA 241]|uniref:hypothetical protein n=1 Tax=Bradyrhizobium sp. USDA 241 TaxID=3377725 RepID=UPI003C78221C